MKINKSFFKNQSVMCNIVTASVHQNSWYPATIYKRMNCSLINGTGNYFTSACCTGPKKKKIVTPEINASWISFVNTSVFLFIFPWFLRLLNYLWDAHDTTYSYLVPIDKGILHCQLKRKKRKQKERKTTNKQTLSYVRDNVEGKKEGETDPK